jgi:hypothetical protein
MESKGVVSPVRKQKTPERMLYKWQQVNICNQQQNM